MHTTTDRVIAANIARLADERRLTVAALARSTGVISPERLRQCITGRASMLGPEVEAVAAALGVEASDLAREAA